MPLIPQVKCRRCGASFSSLRSRCPNCGTRVVAQSSRTPGGTPGTVRGTAANERARANLKWQMAFGSILLIAVILSVIVMTTTSLDGMDTGIVRATPTPLDQTENLLPVVEQAPTPSPTPEPVVENIKLLYMNTKDITEEKNWPTMRVGESWPVNAVVYPMDILNPPIEWSCSDENGEYLKVEPNDDGSAQLTCVAAKASPVDLTAKTYGKSVTIKLYLREADQTQ